MVLRMESDAKQHTSNLDHDNTSNNSNEYTYSLGGDNESVMPLQHVLHAYAGLARPGKYYAPRRNLPSMAPVGLIGFGVSSLFLGLVLIGVRGIKIPNLTICCAWFTGGVGLLTAGLWEFVLENHHGMAVMVTYGLYWWSMAALYTPSFGVVKTFVTYCTLNSAKMPKEFSTPLEWGTEMMTTAFGVWSLGFAFFSFSVVATLVKSTLAFLLCIFFVAMIFLSISIGYLGGSHTMVQVAGGFSSAAGIMALYNGMAGIMTIENSYVHLKPILLGRGTSEVADPDPERLEQLDSRN